jgi:predicted nucleic acid-binding protein
LAVCLDASTVITWLVPQSASRAVADGMRAIVFSNEQLIAPPLLFSESTSVLSQLVYRSVVTADEARDALLDLLALPLHIVSRNVVYETALELAHRLGQAKAYDTQYMAVAYLESATVITSGSGMHNNCLRLGIPSRLLQ